MNIITKYGSLYSKCLNTKQVYGCAMEPVKITEIIDSFYDRAANFCDVSQDKLEFYKTCDMLIKFNLPLIRDDGSFLSVPAYRAIHKTHRLPTIGGIRLVSNQGMTEMSSHSLLESIICGVLDLPFGGAKGSIRIDPKQFSKREIETLLRRYTIELCKKNFMGASIDVYSPDIATGEKEMSTMIDTYQGFAGHEDINYMACVTGKPRNFGGIPGRQEGPGLGAFFATREILEDVEFCDYYGLQPGIKGRSLIVQGYGQVQYYYSKYMVQRGANLIGVCDSEGGIYNSKGFNPDDVFAFKQNNKLTDYPSVEKVFENQEIIYEPCDIFAPGFDLSIGVNNADKFQCKVVVETSKAPISVKGQQILKDKGIRLLPDVLVTGGGIFVSYFEWLKNLDHIRPGRMTRRWEMYSKHKFLRAIENSTGLRMNLEKHKKEIEPLLQGPSEMDLVETGLEEAMIQASTETKETARNMNMTLRTAAYYNAINRIHKFYEGTGVQ